MRQISIAGTLIGEGCPPYLIAEMSANHNGSIENAIEIVSTAKKCGANAVKLQTYTPDTITLNSASPDFQITDGLWAGKTLYELYDWAHTPWDWHKPLFEHARKCDITVFSSPFDANAVDLLEDLNSPAYKIASFEIIDIPLVKYVATTGKPMIISTGMASFDEIEEAIEAARDGGCREIAILHCVSGYPAPAAEYNLRTIPDLIKQFDLVAGLSDHTLTNVTAIGSIALGASIIEKHFTLDRNGGGPDDSFSLEPPELAALCTSASEIWSALGEVNYELTVSERENRRFRRSLYVVRNLEAGERITLNDVRSVRPGYGLPPKYLPKVLGCKVSRAVAANSALTLDVLEGGDFNSLVD